MRNSYRAGFRYLDSGLPVKLITMENAISLLQGKYPRFFDNRLFELLTYGVGSQVGTLYPPVDVRWMVFRLAQDGPSCES